MDFIIEHWGLVLVLTGLFIFLTWGLIALANAKWERKDKANAICQEFEDRIDKANTIDELLEIEKELIGGYTTPNPFKDDSVLIKLNNPERVKSIMLYITRKIRWVKYSKKVNG